MNFKFFFEAISKFVLGVVLLGLLIFVPAGTLFFTNGLVLMGLLFIPMFLAGLFLMAKNPELLKKRLMSREKEKEQTLVVKLSGLMFVAGFVIAGLGYRFGWYMLPRSVVVVSSILFLISYVLYAEVMRENAYLSRTVEVFENQKVVDTGLYSVVRHPMYTSTLILFLSMPLILGSVYSFLIFLAYPFIIAKRIKNEEEVLERELDGYREYKQKVKWRLIPFVF